MFSFVHYFIIQINSKLLATNSPNDWQLIFFNIRTILPLKQYHLEVKSLPFLVIHHSYQQSQIGVRLNLKGMPKACVSICKLNPSIALSYS